MPKTGNHLGMSALISHPEKKPIEEQMQIFASVGFDSFFLSCGVTDQFERIPFWSNCAKQIGIDFEAVHAPSDMVDAVWQGTEAAAAYKKATERIIDHCSAGEISKLVLHTGTDPSLFPTECGLEFWHNLENYAKQRAVSLCYENANTPMLFEAVVASADSFHGVCHDIGHQLCYTPQLDYVNLFCDKIRYTHIHDNLADGRDLHFLPKDGVCDWNGYFSRLRQTGYSGTLNLELSCYHNPMYRDLSFEQFAKIAYDRLRQFNLQD